MSTTSSWTAASWAEAACSVSVGESIARRTASAHMIAKRLGLVEGLSGRAPFRVVANVISSTPNTPGLYWPAKDGKPENRGVLDVLADEGAVPGLTGADVLKKIEKATELKGVFR